MMNRISDMHHTLTKAWLYICTCIYIFSPSALRRGRRHRRWGRRRYWAVHWRWRATRSRAATTPSTTLSILLILNLLSLCYKSFYCDRVKWVGVFVQICRTPDKVLLACVICGLSTFFVLDPHIWWKSPNVWASLIYTPLRAEMQWRRVSIPSWNQSIYRQIGHEVRKHLHVGGVSCAQ